VAREVDDVRAQVVLLEHLPHGGLVGVHALQGLGVAGVKVADVYQKLPEAPLLKQAHQTFRVQE